MRRKSLSETQKEKWKRPEGLTNDDVKIIGAQSGGGGGGGGPRLSEISCTYDPPIYDITSGFRVATLFSREAQRWTPSAIWFSSLF